jgi:hypothetical protein
MAKPCQAPRSESRGSEKEAGWARIRKVKAKAQKLISMLCPKTWGQPSLIELSLYPIVRKKQLHSHSFQFMNPILTSSQISVGGSNLMFVGIIHLDTFGIPFYLKLTIE